MLRHSEKCTVTFTPHSVNMSVKQGRICPICFKENLYYLNDHLRQVHQLSRDERKPWLKAAVFSNTKTLPYFPTLPFWSMQQQTMGLNSPLTQPQAQTQSSKPRKVKKPVQREFQTDV